MNQTLLIVEDDPGMVEVVSYVLESEGYRVARAARADAALASLRRTKPDLIVSDVMMPGMSGFTFCQRVRDDARWSQIPFIFLTAKGQHTDVRFGMGLGADDYLVKPFDPEDLLIAVRTRLERASEARGARNRVDADYRVSTPAGQGRCVGHGAKEGLGYLKVNPLETGVARSRRLLNRLAQSRSNRYGAKSNPTAFLATGERALSGSARRGMQHGEGYG